MLKLNQEEPLLKELTNGFNGSISVINHSQVAITAANEIYRQIVDRCRVLETPLYFGEAERLMLMPLIDVTDSPCQSVFNLAASYAIIEEIAKVSMPRDLSSALSYSMISSLPIVQKLSLAGLFSSRTTLPKENNLSEEAFKLAGGKVTWTGAPKVGWANFMNVLSSIPTATTQGPDALSVLGSIYNLGDLDAFSNDLGSLFTNLSKYAKTGKGFPLSKDERENYINGYLGKALRLLRSNLVKLEEGSNDNAWYEFVTVARWLDCYLTAIESYDDTFPAAPLQTQSTAWVMTLKTTAQRLKQFFLNLSLIAVSESVQYSKLMLDDLMELFTPMLPQASSTDDLVKLISEFNTNFTSVASDWGCQIARETVDRFKTYSSTKLVLDSDWEGFSKLAQTMLSDAVSNLPNSLPTGLDALYSLPAITKRVHVSSDTRDMLVISLSNIASALKSAASLMSQSADYINGYQPSFGTMPIVQGTDFKYSYPSSSLGCMPQKTSFTRMDPFVSYYPKYKLDKEGVQNWALTDLLNKVVYAQDMARSIGETYNQMYWPPVKDILCGEPFLTPYTQAPPFSNYTYKVAADRVPCDWDHWAQIMMGADGFRSSPISLLHRIVEAIATDSDRNSTAIANYLCATAFMYSVSSTGKIEGIIKPSIPTIYGATTAQFIAANELDDAAAAKAIKSSSTIWNSGGSRYWFIKNDRPSASNIQGILFVLHSNVPIIPDTLQFYFHQIARGEYCLLAAPGVSADTRFSLDASISYDVKFEPVQGFCPVKLNLPHLLYDVNFYDVPSSADLFYQNIWGKLRYRYENADRSISLLAIAETSALVWEHSDYSQAFTESDPLPTQVGGTVKPDSPDLSEDGQGVARGADNGGGVQSTLNPPVDADKVKEAAKVAGGSVLQDDPAKAPVITAQDQTKVTAKVGVNAIPIPAADKPTFIPNYSATGDPMNPDIAKPTPGSLIGDPSDSEDHTVEGLIGDTAKLEDTSSEGAEKKKKKKPAESAAATDSGDDKDLEA